MAHNRYLQRRSSGHQNTTGGQVPETGKMLLDVFHISKRITMHSGKTNSLLYNITEMSARWENEGS